MDHIDNNTKINQEEVCHACRLDDPPPDDGGNRLVDRM
jgi:hypothetical protein